MGSLLGTDIRGGGLILRDAVNPKIREYGRLLATCLNLPIYRNVDLILVSDRSAFSVFVQMLVCTEFVYLTL